MHDALAGRFKRCNPELCLGDDIDRRPKRNNRRYFSFFTLLKANLDLQPRNRPLRPCAIFQKIAMARAQVPRVAFDMRLFWD